MLNIKELINDTSLLNTTTLKELELLVNKYPFFQLARLLYICNLYKLRDPELKSEIKKASMFVPDRTALFYLTENAKYEIEATENADNNSDENKINRTISLINTYLSEGCIEIENTQASQKDNNPSLADLTNDYASYLMKLDEGDTAADSNDTPHLKGEDLINNFISETQGKQRINMTDSNDDNFTSPELSEEEEEVYTESMVNIYIKQGRYAQALEILHKICLNNPKKNSTFASQIRLLEIITKNTPD